MFFYVAVSFLQKIPGTVPRGMCARGKTPCAFNQKVFKQPAFENRTQPAEHVRGAETPRWSGQPMRCFSMFAAVCFRQAAVFGERGQDRAAVPGRHVLHRFFVIKKRVSPS